MTSTNKRIVVMLLAVAAAAVGFGQGAYAQQSGGPKANPGAPAAPHMGGGTVPGPGTHGHSSSAKPEDTKEIQEKQHNMPAAPSHSSAPTK